MIPTTTKNFPTSSIVIPRSTRQRTDLTPASVYDLAYSIAKQQTLLQPIGVDETTNEIIFGERRLTSIKLLHDLYTTEDLPQIEGLSEAELSSLKTLASNPPSWSEKWTKIPARVGKDLSPFDRETFEFIENAHRKELPWQDRARAVHRIHQLGLEQSDDWTAESTADHISLSYRMVAHYLQIWRAANSGDESLKSQILESETYKAALALINRNKSRTEPTLSFRKLTNPTPKQSPAGEKVTATEAPDKSVASTKPYNAPHEPEVPILNQSLLDFAPAYTGPGFNFIHCDFPYGINYNTSASQGTAADTKALGAYDDSPETYFNLIEALFSSELIADSAHILFWYSPSLREETKKAIYSHRDDAIIQPFDMIWARTDNSGICPDPQRYGRRTYDTAMLITFGDRLIVQPKALSICAPWGDKIHRSQKPLDVVSHFMSMFVDKHSTVFDGTCGSGTALVAARQLEAKQVFGLEIDKETYNRAVNFYKESS